MTRLIFNDAGSLIGADGNIEDKEEKDSNLNNFSKQKFREIELKKSDSLDFLKDEIDLNNENKLNKNFNSIYDNSFWDLKIDGKKVKPLEFSNGKSQEDVIKEIVDLIKSGVKVIFLHGTCGTGKSAIALNIARILGNTSIVVPVKNLQKQYEEDYLKSKYLNKPNGQKLKIAMLTGRENHDSIIKPGISCADPTLPENIKITDRNYGMLMEYYEQNPLIFEKIELDLKDIRRIFVAPTNPYWSPILPADFEMRILKDSKKIKYKGADGRDYIFYHRKEGCSYYDQYLSYKQADVIIFNAAKYKAEMALGRKPLSEVDIIDEADEFLDGLFQQEELNLTRLVIALKNITSENEKVKESIKKILHLISLEEKNKRATGVDPDEVFHINDTKIFDILNQFLIDANLEAEIIIDELNYSNRALETARNFSGNFNEVYVTYRKEEENIFVRLSSTNLSSKFEDLLSKTKALIFMSGTLHSMEIIENIFGVKDYKIVEAETFNQGSLEIIRTGKEFDCKYSNFSSKNYSRENYLESFSECIKKSKNPTLVHVHAYSDLPSQEEIINNGIDDIPSSDRIRNIQREDKVGDYVLMFKKGLTDVLFTTKCYRGIDFPGEICNSIIFSKYPNPNISDVFWKILKKTHPNHFWAFYKDKARREFLQRIYRAVRSNDDHVCILSPDIRVIESVQKLQGEIDRNKR